MECFIVNYTQFNSFYKFILSLSRKINCTSINLTLVRKVLWKLLESFLRLTCWSEFSVTVTCFSPACLPELGSFECGLKNFFILEQVTHQSCLRLFTVIVTQVIQETKNQTYWNGYRGKLDLYWKWLLYPKISHKRQFQIYVL